MNELVKDVRLLSIRRGKTVSKPIHQNTIFRAVEEGCSVAIEGSKEQFT